MTVGPQSEQLKRIFITIQPLKGKLSIHSNSADHSSSTTLERSSSIYGIHPAVSHIYSGPSNSIWLNSWRYMPVQTGFRLFCLASPLSFGLAITHYTAAMRCFAEIPPNRLYTATAFMILRDQNPKSSLLAVDESDVDTVTSISNQIDSVRPLPFAARGRVHRRISPYTGGLSPIAWARLRLPIPKTFNIDELEYVDVFNNRKESFCFVSSDRLSRPAIDFCEAVWLAMCRCC